MLMSSSILKPGRWRVLAGGFDRLLADRGAACPELLNITDPRAVRAAHDLYLDAGAEVIRTNTLGGSPERLDRYRMHDEAFIVSYMAAEHAVKSARAAVTRTGHARWVLGVARVEGRTRLTGFLPLDRVEAAARTMASGLAGGGVDAILVESIQDPARLTAAIDGTRRGLADAGRSLPILLTLRFDPFFASPASTARDWVTGDLVAAASAAAGLGVDAVSVAHANLVDRWLDTLRALESVYPGPLFVDCDPGRVALFQLRCDPALGPRVVLMGGGVTPEDTVRLGDLIAGGSRKIACPVLVPGFANDDTALPFRQPRGA